MRRGVIVAVLTLGVLAFHSSAQANITILMVGSGLTTGGALNAAFAGVTTADVTPVVVDDTALPTNSAVYWNTYGTSAAYSSTSYYAYLIKFDLSSIASNAVINKAQVRFYESAGNGDVMIAPVLTHDWNQTLASAAGYNKPTSPNKTWGPASSATRRCRQRWRSWRWAACWPSFGAGPARGRTG